MKKVFDDIEDFDDEEDADDYSQKDKKFYHKTAAVLFLIDARKKMFSLEFCEEKSAFTCCLECVKNTMRKKIFNEEKCYCGILLLGTKDFDNPLKVNNITLVQDLFLLGANHILKVNELLKDTENSLYESKYGFDNFSLGDAFWLSTHIFNERSQRLNKTILLFTNDDNSVTDHNNDFKRAMASANDMKKNNIVLDIIQLGKNFNTDKFYSKILKTSHEDVHFTIPDPVTNMEEIEKRAFKISFKHVPLVKLPFVISDDFKIGVSIHFLVKKTKIPFKVKLSKSTNEKVFSKMQLFETETGSLVQEENIIKSQVIGQKDINFTLRELRAISESEKIELRLMGFKPASVVTLENFVRPCAFVYPDESTFKGSSVFFTALLNRCIAKQVVPICTLCLRKTSACRFVALIGQNENTTSNCGKDLPQGFVVFFLPFAEEIRPLDDTSTKRANPEQVEIAKKLIKKLKFQYRIESFQNPRLKTHWAAIEALALDLPEPESVDDSTYPNYDLISARTKNIANEFAEAVYSDGYDPEVCGAPKKLKPSTAKPNPEVNIENVEKLIKDGEGERLSNDILKAFLKLKGDGKGLSKIKKSDLLERAKALI